MGLINLLRKKCNILFFTTPSHSRSFLIFHKLRNFYKYDISETEFHNPESALKKAMKHQKRPVVKLNETDSDISSFVSFSSCSMSANLA